MSRIRSWRTSLTALLSVLVFLSSLPLAAAEETGQPEEEPFIRIGSEWQGSVFGDVGGQDKITLNNFSIMEQEDGSVTIRSVGDRGKIAGGSEGLAYYYQAVQPEDNYELTATAHVDHWGAANNQVSFGLMLRSNILENEHAGGSFTGNYAAAGALDQKMKAFYKSAGTLVKNGMEFEAASPQTGESYQLRIKKSGSLIVLSVNGEVQTISELTDEYRYVGLYTARNAVVTYTDVELKREGEEPEVELGEWEFSAFGGNTSLDKNPAPTVVDHGALRLTATGGKIAAGDEGMSYVYKKIPQGVNFELEAQVTVHAFNQTAAISTPNQKSFGLMLRESVGTNGDASTQTTSYAAVGALDQVMKGYYKQHGSQTKLEPYEGSRVPAAGESYTLRIRKMGDTVILSNGEQSEVVTLDGALQGEVYAGLYVARDADVTFTGYEIRIDNRKVQHIEVDASAMKTVYRVGEPLQLDGLQVKAIYADQSAQLLAQGDYIVTGFDSSQPGSSEVTVHYNGLAAKIALTISALSATSLRVKYYPAKTVYYPGDQLDLAGLIVEASYDDGYLIAELPEEDYIVSVNGQAVTSESPYLFGQHSGESVVEITAAGAPQVKTSFTVAVKEAAFLELVIGQQPEQLVYYLGDELDLDGLVLYAVYSDGSRVRLMRGEYEVEAFHTDVPGTRDIRLTHKGKSVALPVTVKARELAGIEITRYPQTTYQVGESFNAEGLMVAKRYDNGDLEPYTDFELDTSRYDNALAGIYELAIRPADQQIEPIALRVAVREAKEYTWRSIRFGQSTSNANNKVNVQDNGVIELIALEGGGKVTGDHDGIAYYYTELDAMQDNFELSADIRVKAYAKSPHDGQESFGIMARDVIGEPNTSSVFASNIAAIGGYSGGTRDANGTQLFVRTGVESPDGAGSKGIQPIMIRNELPGPGNTYPAAAYRLSLSKTNSGFVGRLNDGREELIFEPDILKIQDSGKMYVGFYAARLATIEVSHIELRVTASETDPPKVLPEADPIVPQLEILSREKASEGDYRLIMRSNVSGVARVKQGQHVIAEELEMAAGERVEVAAKLPAQTATSFSISYLPGDTQRLTSYEQIVRNFSVRMTSYREGADIYVSPAGTPTGDGSEQQPLDLDTAVEFVQPGQRIIVLEGRYVRSKKLEIGKYNDGREGAMKTLTAAPGTRPVIDFDKKTEGVVLSGSYWHVYGLDFTRSAGNMKGFTVGGSHNIVENSRFYENGDTGLQISRTDTTENDRSQWPSYNLILNSTAFDNRDPSDNNADGFAAKLTVGVGNIFRGCIAHNNIDDGWDLYTKAGTGAIGPVIIENSIAYNNGFLQNGTVGAGDKNGFKLGGEGIHVPHIIRNSLAFGNGAYGFTSNSNPGVIALHNIAFNNARGNLSFTTYPAITPDFKLEGFVSFQMESAAKDNYPTKLQSPSNYLFDGSAAVNSKGVQLTAANFVSLEPVTVYERDEQGDIQWGDFLRFIAPSSGETPGSYYPSAGPAAMAAEGNKQNEDGSVTILTKTDRASATHSTVKVGVTSLREAVAQAKADHTGRKTVHVAADGGYDSEATDGMAYEFSLPAASLREDAAVGLELKLHAPGVTVTVPAAALQQSLQADTQHISIVMRTTDKAAGMQPQSQGLPAGSAGRAVTVDWLVDGIAGARQLVEPVQITLRHAAQGTKAERLSVYKLEDSTATDEGTGSESSTAVELASRYHQADGTIQFETAAPGMYVIWQGAKSFTDVPDTHWAYREIHELAALGIIQGVKADGFEPGRPVSRADYALLLVRALEKLTLLEEQSSNAAVTDSAAGAASTSIESAEAGTKDANVGSVASEETAAQTELFRDVPQGAYYYEELKAAQRYGLIRGGADGNFYPQRSISRQEMFVMTARALLLAGFTVPEMEGSTEQTLSTVGDRLALAEYAKQDTALLIETGLVRGNRAGRVLPQAGASRAEAATLIFRLIELLSQTETE